MGRPGVFWLGLLLVSIGVALALWCVDSPLTEDVVAEIRALPLIGTAQVVQL